MARKTRAESPGARASNGVHGTAVQTNMEHTKSVQIKGGIADTSGAVRSQSRPIGEFGGNLGCLFWTIVIPIWVWYFYGIVVIKQGELVMPNRQFWDELIWGLPEGIAIRPTWKGINAFVMMAVFQAVMEIMVPTSSVKEGVTLKNGRKLLYPMNGLRCFFITHVVCYALAYLDLMDPSFAWRNMGSLLTGAVIISHVVSLWMYIDYGIFWRRHVNDPEFEEDWGVFSWKECIVDYFLGCARNPRLFHGWLKIPLDIKRYFNARVGLTIWVICNQSYVASMYYGCRIEENAAVCNEVGDWSRVGSAALMITLAHWYYIFDYNWNEPAYLTTTDIRHDLYGFMLMYGCNGFLAWYYSFSFLGHIAFQKTPLNDNHLHFAVGTSLYVFGMWLFRVTNIQKHNFRTYIQEGGDLSKYNIWGKPVQYIKTEEGSYLLTSGWWGFARHFNYIGDMVMCIGWAIACTGPSHGFPWAPLSYCVYFWMMDIHRLTRDEDRCAVKYKKDWVAYKEAVPWFIVPGIF